MYLGLIRRLYGFRCPNCAALQPVFNLSTTWRPTFGSVRMNEDVACVSCAKRLCLQPQFDRVTTTVLSMGVGLLAAALFFGVFFAVMGFALGLFGLWGLLALPMIALFWHVMTAALMGLFGPYFRKVTLV